MKNRQVEDIYLPFFALSGAYRCLNLNTEIACNSRVV